VKTPGIPHDYTGALMAPDQTSCALVLLTTSRQAISVPTGATHVFISNTAACAVAYSATAGSSAASLTTASSGANEVFAPGSRGRWIGKGNVAELTMLAPTAGGYVSLDFRGTT